MAIGPPGPVKRRSESPTGCVPTGPSKATTRLGVRSREETEGVIVKRVLRCPAPIAASLSALVLVVAVSGCGGGSGGGTAPPSNLTYSANPATYTKGAPIAANTPSSSGGAVASYSVSPALPAGLRLDGSTGVITGTPTAAAAAANYVVTATNSGGGTTASVRITIVDAPSGGSAALVGGASHLTSGTLTMEAIVGPPFNPSGASGTKTLRPAENTR